jgi:hypothetical protein
MALKSRIVRLNWTYRTTGTDRGQTGHRAHECPAGRGDRPTWIAGSGTCGWKLRGTEVLEAIMAGAVVAIAVAVFLGGMVVAVVALAVHREDRYYTLAGAAPTGCPGILVG